MSDLVRARVVMQQAWVPRYRAPFFDRVRRELRARDVDFQLVHGHPHGENAGKGSAVTVEWAHLIPQRVLRVAGREVTWQPILRHIRGADLVICEQASSQLAMYVAFAYAACRSRQRFALWGHGRNFQSGRASSAGEAVKRWISRRADWWFAYNERSVEVLDGIGVPSERVTSFQNAIDTTRLVAAREGLREEELDRLRAELRVEPGHAAVYVGGMYREKRLAYLLRACDEIRRVLPTFAIMFIGDGPDSSLVKEHARSRPWMHVMGPLFEEAKVPYVRLASLQLMPGLVGLTVLDSFALEVPLVTVADSEHSPEVAYLRDGENGVVLPAGTTPAAYAERVVGLLRDHGELRRLVEGCGRARGVYTLDSMVERFVSGVQDALRSPPRGLVQRMSGRGGR